MRSIAIIDRAASKSARLELLAGWAGRDDSPAALIIQPDIAARARARGAGAEAHMAPEKRSAKNACIMLSPRLVARSL